MEKLVPGKRPLVPRNILVETILKHKHELVFNNEIARATAAVWKVIEAGLDNKIKATSLHSMCVGNRYHLKSLLTDTATLDADQEYEVSLNECESSESNRNSMRNSLGNSFNFILSIKTSKFESLLTERVYARKTMKGKIGERRITIFQPSKWTEIVSKKIYDDYRLNHGYHFKNHYLTRQADYGVFKGLCKCGSTVICKAKENVENANYEGISGKKIAKDLQTESTVKWRHRVASEMMDKGISVEPPHLYNADVLRVAKHECIRMQYLDQDPIKAIAILKKSSVGQNVIRDIGYDPFHVTIASAHQIRVFNKMNRICETNLSIDATGGVAKKIVHVDGRVSKHIFLYNAESHDMASISKWLLGTIRCGMEFPRQVTIDESKALENACALIFSGDFNITKYANRCFNTGKTDFPKTYIRTDVAHYIKSWVNFFSKESKEKWKKKFYLCAIGQLILCRDRDSAKCLITALLTVSLSEKAGVGATSLNESLHTIKSLVLGNTCQEEEVEEIISKTIEDSEKDIEEATEEGEDEDEPQMSNLVANQWQQWGNDIRNEVERKLEYENGDDYNPRYFPAFAERLMKKMATIPLWSCICRDDFGYGRIPASSAPVEAEFNIIKNRILCKRILRVDVAVRTFLEYIDGKLKIFEAKSNPTNENINIEIKSTMESPRRPKKIDVSDDATPNFPVVSLNSTTAYEIAQKFNSSRSRDIFKDELSPISSTKNDTHCPSGSIEKENFSGSKCESYVPEESIRRRKPLHDLSSEMNQEFVCEYCEKKSNNEQVCVICKRIMCSECTVSQTEEEGEMKLCLECFQNSRKDDRLATQKIDNWKGKGGSPKISKKSRYLNKNTAEFLDAMSFKKYCKLPCLKNGTISSLRLIKIGNSEVSLTNTCAFDSITQILMAAMSDNDNIKKFMNIHRYQNNFFDLVYDTVEHGISQKTYKRRAEIICHLFGEEIKDNTTHEINCTTSASSLAAKIFKTHPSFIEIRQCEDGCYRKIEYATYGWHARLLKENLQTFIETIATKEKRCKNNCETYQSVSLEMGDIVLFEVYGQEDKIPIDSISNSFINKSNETYHLMGVIHYVGPKMLTRTPIPGHYIAYCKRGTCWMVYDDLKEKAERSSQNLKVYPEILVYCKI
ncbi:unnamed protein product [Phaedon cochleariae]|uniref:USP domain-containing protein n=1 Tax=Phaedon cochleariae TaxID=80249 RepID=A0A9P0GXG4_PHACE|nr:unnamed protein product [Phaedon cochleariae]